MKIEIDVEDISLFAKALNNSTSTYGNILFAICIGGEIPEKLKPLENIPYEELKKRFNCIKNVYKQIEKSSI